MRKITNLLILWRTAPLGLSLFILFIVSTLSACKDDEPTPPAVVQFDVIEQSLTEGQEVVILVTLSRALSEASSVKVSITGNATYGTDYFTNPAGVGGSFVLTLPKGEAVAQFTVATLNNDVYVGNKILHFSLEDPGAGITLGTKKNLDLTLVDDESAALANFQVGSASTDENSISGVTVQIPFTLLTKGPGTINVSFASNNAVYETNFTTIPPAINNTVVLDVDNNASGTSLTIVPVNDAYFHDDFVIVFEITSGTGSVRPGENKTFTLTIHEDDSPSLADFNIPSATIPETQAAGVVVQIPLSIPAAADGSITVSYASPNSTYGTHFTTTPPAAGNHITLNVGLNDTQAQFTVLPVDDDVDNDNRVITFTISATGGVVRPGTALTYVLTITDNEPTLRTVLISFGRASAPQVPGPDTWNHLYDDSPSGGDSWSNLVRSDGVATGIGVTMNSSLTPQPLGPVTGINSGVFPDNAMKEYWYVPGPNQGITRGFSITFLNNDTPYTIKIHGGTTNVSADGRNSMTVSVEGVQKSIEDVTNNVTEFLLWPDVLPSASKITINLTDTDGGGICMINAMSISWYEE